MPVSGFVLVGGRSTRMGRDKGLLPYRGTLLVKHIAGIVGQVARPVVLIGDPDRYGSLGYGVHADDVLDCGPMGGIFTALSHSQTAWNLIVACDMPEISVEVLRSLVARTDLTMSRIVAASGLNGGAEPLCAVYHRDCLPLLAQAIRDKRFKMKELLLEIGSETQSVDPSSLINVNTPGDWAATEGYSR